MNSIKRTLLLSLGALGAALILEVPATAAETTEARDSRDRFAQVGSHPEYGARPELRGANFDSGPGQGHFHLQRVHYRGHYGHGHRYWRGYHWRRYHWRGHRPYWRLYRHHPHYGHHYGYGYGHLGYGASLVS
jgi:hypothetical protein